jgi:hypothetical protein
MYARIGRPPHGQHGQRGQPDHPGTGSMPTSPPAAPGGEQRAARPPEAPSGGWRRRVAHRPIRQRPIPVELQAGQQARRTAGRPVWPRLRVPSTGPNPRKPARSSHDRFEPGGTRRSDSSSGRQARARATVSASPGPARNVVGKRGQRAPQDQPQRWVVVAFARKWNPPPSRADDSRIARPPFEARPQAYGSPPSAAQAGGHPVLGDVLGHPRRGAVHHRPPEPEKGQGQQEGRQHPDRIPTLSAPHPPSGPPPRQASRPIDGPRLPRAPRTACRSPNGEWLGQCRRNPTRERVATRSGSTRTPGAGRSTPTRSRVPRPPRRTSGAPAGVRRAHGSWFPNSRPRTSRRRRATLRPRR